MSTKALPPQSPAHYWAVAAAALAEEQSVRLRAMREIDGLLALNRLTMGHHTQRDNRFEKDGEVSFMAALFRTAYGSRL